MAVRHGYGKIAGTDALVFAYDTGDTRNSYKGEPTVNHISGGSNVADCINGPINYGAQGGVTVVATVEYYSEKRPHVFRIKSTNDTGYNMINQQSSIQNQSGTTYTYSYDFKQLKGSTQQDSSCTVYGNGYKSPDSSGYSSNVSIVNTPLEDGWTRRAITYTATYTGYNWYRFNLWTGGARADGAGDFEFLFDNFQIETNSHATPFTNNTRSATEGLLDLTGNHPIDLSNVSFNSSGALEFDGTNDGMIVMHDTSVFTNSSFSVEIVLNHHLSSGNKVFFSTGIPTGTGAGLHLRVYNTGKLRMGYYGDDLDTAPNIMLWDKNYHLVFLHDYNTDTSRIYVNGVLMASGANGPYTGPTASPSIGYWEGTAGEYFDGQIHVVKVYNRALTSAEVLTNFNHYKTRYNL